MRGQGKVTTPTSTPCIAHPTSNSADSIVLEASLARAQAVRYAQEPRCLAVEAPVSSFTRNHGVSN